MDQQTCKNCGKTFDFDKGGFGSSMGGHVCSAECGKKSAAKSGRCYAVHDETDAIVDTDVAGLKS